MRTVAAALCLVAPTACVGAVDGDEAARGGAPGPSVTATPLPIADPAPATSEPDPSPTPVATPSRTPERTPDPPTAEPARRPAWLGTRVLPERPDGYGEVRPTPPELVDRRLPPAHPDLPAPERDAFAATVAAVPDAVAARSTWTPDCPVALDELRYVTLTFWGFDDRPHTGELLVHARVAEDLLGVFERLYEARFPIEEMRVVDAAELDAPRTGDGNNTTGFVCRPAVGQQRWSEHAYGLAVDVNPFHNPYVRGDLVLPELASAYLDRDDHRPGMIQPGDVVTTAFASIGWGWGGDWQRSKDWMHFSASGR